MVPSHYTDAQSTPKGRRSVKQEIKLRSHRGHVETSAGHFEPSVSTAAGGPPSAVGVQEVPLGAPGG